MSNARMTSAVGLTLSVVSSLSLYGQAPKGDSQRFISSMSGTWTEDESKRTIGSGLDMRFRTSASGGLQELRGPILRPMVQPVKLDGKPYEVEGTTMVWKEIDAHNFQRTTSRAGKELSVRRIKLSEDGKTATEEMKRTSL